MLMLQRAAENVNPSECNDPAVLLACSLGSDSCPAACQKKADDENSDTEKKDTNRVIAGDLDVSVVDYSSSIQSAPQGIFVANTLKFNASEKIQLDSLTLKRTGLGSSKSISKVWLEKNGVAVTNSASVGSDGLAVLNFKSNRDTISEATEYQLVVELKQNDANNNYQGDEFAFELQSAESTAKNTTIKGTTTTYRISNYKVVELTANVSNPNTASAWKIVPVEYKLGDSSDYIIWEFSLQSESSKDDRDIYVKSLTFKNNGTADFGDTFKNVKVYRDSKVVSNNVEVNGKDITISLDKDVIKANRKALYTIRAEVATLERAWDTVQLSLKDSKDIIADEADTNFRAKITLDANWANGAAHFSQGELSLYKFNGGKVTFETDTKFAKSVNVGVGASDVVIARGSLNVTESVELPEIIFDLKNTTNNVAAKDANWNDLTTKVYELVKRLVLKIGDKRYTADVENGVAKFTDVSVRSSADVELLISLNSTTVKDGTEIKIADFIGNTLMTWKSGTFQNNDSELKKDDVAGSVQIAKVIVKKPKFTITTSSLNTQDTVKNDSTQKVLMEGSLQAKDNDVNVNQFKVTLNTPTGAKAISATDDSAEIYLALDGKNFGNTPSLKAGNSYTFNSLGTIKAGESLPFKVSVSPRVANGGKELYVTVQAFGTDNNGNDTETAEEYSATLNIKGDATLEVNSTSKSDRVTNPTNNIAVYEGEINVENWTTTLESFAITRDTTKGALLTIAGTSYKLSIDGEPIDATVDTTTTPGVISFAISENLTEGKHKVEVKANVDAQVNAATQVTAVEAEATYDVSTEMTDTDWTYTYAADGTITATQVTATDQAVWALTLNGKAFTVTTAWVSSTTQAVATYDVSTEMTDTDWTYTYATNGTITATQVSANDTADVWGTLTINGKAFAIAVKGVAAKTAANANDFIFAVTKTTANVGKANAAESSSKVNTYFAKGYFNLAKTSSDKSNLVVKLTNNSNKTVKISSVVLGEYDSAKDNVNVTIDWNKATLNGKIARLANSSTVSVSAGQSIDIRIAATTKDTYVTLDGVEYIVTDGDDYYYTLSDAVSSVGAWGDFYASQN